VADGITQAKQHAHHISKKREYYQITKLISSDLQRTLTTASYLSEALGLPIQKEPILRETNNGVLAGMLNAEALVRYPGLFFSSLKMDEPYPGGESPNQFFDRIKNWFLSFIDQNKNADGNILIVTHGGVIRIIYHLVNNIPWSNKAQIYKADHCSIHILNTDTMRFEIENWTDFL
jgi:broad specificity phosphatase PhoE